MTQTESKKQQQTTSFRVYHLTDTRPRAEQARSHNYPLLDIQDDPFKAAGLMATPVDGCEYRLVAEVLAASLDDAFHLTNTIDHFWWSNTGVTKRFNGTACRSTKVGDVVVDGGGTAHFCDRGFGWVEIGAVATTPIPRGLEKSGGGTNHPGRPDYKGQLGVFESPYKGGVFLVDIAEKGTDGSLSWVALSDVDPRYGKAIARAKGSLPEAFVVTLPEGYNGHTLRFYADPEEVEGETVRLRCAEPGKEYMFAWRSAAAVRAAINARVSEPGQLQSGR